MAWSARARWVAYGIAALATVAAMRWVDEAAVRDEPVAAAAAPAAPRAATRQAPGAATAARSRPGAPAGGDSEVRLDWLARTPMGEVTADPFGAAPVEPPRAPVRAAAPPPPPAPQAPPLPFTYVGKWMEDGRTIVFLARGGQNVAVRGAGKLDDMYEVQSIDDRQVVLKYLPLGTQQVLSLAPPGGAQVATAPAESASQGTEEGKN